MAMGIEGAASRSLSPIRPGPPLDFQFLVDDLIFLEPLCCTCVRPFKCGEQVVLITGCEGTLNHKTVRQSCLPFPHDLLAIDASELARRRGQNLQRAFSSYLCSMDNPESHVATMHPHCYDCLPWLANKPERFKQFRWMVLCRTPFTGAPAQTVAPIPPNPVPLIARLENGDLASVNPVYASEVRDEIYHLRRALEMQLRIRGMAELQTVRPARTLLSLIKRWTRGKAAARLVPLNKHRPSNPIWRIAMDESGITRIEQLDERPQPFTAWKDPTLTYTLVDARSAKDISVVIKYGLARLELPVNSGGLQIWDTPTPPQPDIILHLPQGTRPSHSLPPFVLDDCMIDWGRDLEDPSGHLWIYRRLVMRDLYASRNLLNSFRHFHTVPLTSGLTFLYDEQKRLVDIYSGFLTLINNLSYPPRAGQNISYIHLPLAPEDQIEDITAKGVLIPDLPNPDMYQTIDFTIVTKLAGEVHIGPDNLDDEMRPYPLPLPLSSMRSYQPAQLVYSKRGNDDKIDVVGAIPAPDSTTGIRQFNGFKQSCSPINELPPAFYTEAPLRNISRADLFGDQNHIIGLMLYYHNGAKRAMGEYRPGMVATRVVNNPVRVYLDMDMKSDSFKNIDFIDEDGHRDHCCAENCFEMRGLLTLRWDRETIPDSEDIHFSSQFRIEKTDRIFPTDLPWNPWSETARQNKKLIDRLT